MGRRPSSRSVAMRLSRLTPRRWRPSATPSSCAVGTRRRRHTEQVRAMKTCSVTCTGTTGNSMTSRVRWVQPPDRWAPQSGQLSTTCSTRWVGVMRGRAKPWRRCFRGPCCAGQLAARTGLEAGHSGRAVRFRLASQFGNPPLQPLNHPLLFQNGGLRLGDDGDQEIAVGGDQVTLSIHSLYMT